MELWQFKVQDLVENESSLFSFKVSAEDIDFSVEDAQVVSPVTVDTVLFRTDKDVFVDAVIRSVFHLECGLCLTSFPQSFETNFSIRYETTDNPELVDDPLMVVGLRYYVGDYIDIANDIKEALLLEIPHWPICAEDCRGLCAVCGQNLNEKSCDCDPSLLRPGKLADLAVLLGE